MFFFFFPPFPTSEQGLELRTWICYPAKQLMSQQTPARSENRPEPTHAPGRRERVQRAPAGRLLSTPLTWESFSLRDKNLETVNSDTLALQQHPFSCCSSWEPRYSGERKRKQDESGEGGRTKKRKSWKIYSFLALPLCRSPSLSCSPSPKFDY